jgi:hypothetical protein
LPDAKARTNVHPLPFPAGQHHDGRIAHLLEAKEPQNPFDLLPDDFRRFVEPEAGRVRELIPDRQVPEENVGLLHVRDLLHEALQIGLGEGMAVDADRSLLVGGPAGQHVHEGRFARPARTHGRQDLSGHGLAAHLVQNGFDVKGAVAVARLRHGPR